MLPQKDKFTIATMGIRKITTLNTSISLLAPNSRNSPEVFQSDCFDKLFQKTENISVLREADTQTPLCGFMSEVKHDLW